MAPERVVGPRECLAREFVRDLGRAVAAAPPARPFTLAVPGGSVAHAFFPSLARADVDWRRVAVLFVDERAVPPDSPESNFALAQALWLGPAGVPAGQVHRMPAERTPIADAAAAYATTLRALAGDPPQLDLVLLGVGTDRHVASLFPGDDARASDGDETVAWTTRAPKPPAARLTLTFATLARASRLAIAALGPDKTEAVARAVRDGGDASPLARLLRAAPHARLLLDDAAAGMEAPGA